MIGNFPDDFNARAFAERCEQPDLTPDQEVDLALMLQIEGLLVKLRVAMEDASNFVQRHYLKVGKAIGHDELSAEDIEIAIRDHAEGQ